MDGEETSRESDTSPNYCDRRIAGRFDSEETEAANMLGNGYNNFLVYMSKKSKCVILAILFPPMDFNQ